MTNFDQHQPTTNDPDLLLAYQQAKEALNLRAKERLEKYYTCVDSDESDCDIGTRNNKENDQSDEDCMVKVILNLYIIFCSHADSLFDNYRVDILWSYGFVHNKV